MPFWMLSSFLVSAGVTAVSIGALADLSFPAPTFSVYKHRKNRWTAVLGDFDYKGHTRHASEDDPQYEIKSDKTDRIAAHKGSALKKTAGKKGR